MPEPLCEPFVRGDACYVTFGHQRFQVTFVAHDEDGTAWVLGSRAEARVKLESLSKRPKAGVVAPGPIDGSFETAVALERARETPGSLFNILRGEKGGRRDG